MPYFRVNAPSRDLVSHLQHRVSGDSNSGDSNMGDAIRRALASRDMVNSPLLGMQADMAAARTARDLGVAGLARQKVEEMQRGDAMRNDPQKLTEFATLATPGMTLPQGEQLRKNIYGVRERPAIEFDNGDETITPVALKAAQVAAEQGGAPEASASRMPDITYAKPDNLPAGAEDAFRAAMAGAQTNLLGRSGMRGDQMAHAVRLFQQNALMNQAANAPDVPTANQAIAAAAGRLRTPYATGSQGQVLDRETGNVDESTQVSQAMLDRLAAARAELGTRGERNTAQAGLATARADAVNRGATDRGGARVSPQQVERWVSEVARKEWDALPARERKGLTYADHLGAVRKRFTPSPTNGGAHVEIQDAIDAMSNGADAGAVRKRFRERNGMDLPKSALDMLNEPNDEEE